MFLRIYAINAGTYCTTERYFMICLQLCIFPEYIFVQCLIKMLYKFMLLVHVIIRNIFKVPPYCTYTFPFPGPSHLCARNNKKILLSLRYLHSVQLALYYECFSMSLENSFFTVIFSWIVWSILFFFPGLCYKKLCLYLHQGKQPFV